MGHVYNGVTAQSLRLDAVDLFRETEWKRLDLLFSFCKVAVKFTSRSGKTRRNGPRVSDIA